MIFKMNGKHLPSRSAMPLVTTIVLVGIVAAVIIALAIADSFTTDTTPLVTTLLGLIAAVVPGLVAVYRIEQTRDEMHTENRNLKEHIDNGLGERISQQVRSDRRADVQSETERTGYNER